MPAKCMRPVVAMLTMVTASATVLAQAGPVGLYHAAVDTYVRSGNIARAVLPLQGWKPQLFEQAVRETIASKDRTRMKAAAVFQLEIAVALAGLSSDTSHKHVDLGADLIDQGRPAFEDAKGQYEAFRLSWYAVAGSVYVATKDFIRARPIVEKTRDLEPQSPRTQTLMGSYYEADASLLNPDDWQTLSQRERLNRERLLRLTRAEEHYRNAVRIDQHYSRALTRLGRVRHLQNDLGEAEAFLGRGLKEARHPSDEYLASLFTGALQFQKNDLAGARTSYERALALMPASQTVVVALGHLEVMAGRPDRAQLLARRFTETPPEPWWGYMDGLFDMIGLQSLRDQVVSR